MSNIETPTYSGPDRRRRRIYVTQNHEYHCLDGVCIAVRDLETHGFITKHPAIGKSVSAGLRLNKNGIESLSPPEAPRPGERIHFVQGVEDPRDVLTSPLRVMERPGPGVLVEYAALPH